jgi:hypothetical protein
VKGKELEYLQTGVFEDYPAKEDSRRRAVEYAHMHELARKWNEQIDPHTLMYYETPSDKQEEKTEGPQPSHE